MEQGKRKVEEVKRQATQSESNCANQIAREKNEYERQVNATQVELDKWQAKYRESVEQLEQVNFEKKTHKQVLKTDFLKK